MYADGYLTILLRSVPKIEKLFQIIVQTLSLYNLGKQNKKIEKYFYVQKLTSPSPHGVEVMHTKSTTVSVQRTLIERLPCINVSPFFLLLHVPPENKIIGSLKLRK